MREGLQPPMPRRAPWWIAGAVLLIGATAGTAWNWKRADGATHAARQIARSGGDQDTVQAIVLLRADAERSIRLLFELAADGSPAVQRQASIAIDYLRTSLAR